MVGSSAVRYRRQPEPEPTFRRWLDRKQHQLQGLRSDRDREGVVTALMRPWEREPGRSLADAKHAVTRSAHEHPGWTLGQREALERPDG